MPYNPLVPPGSQPANGFVHNLLTHAPLFGPVYNLLNTGAHLASGTAGQYGQAPTLFGRLLSSLSGNPTNAPAATPVNSGLPIDPNDAGNPLNQGDSYFDPVTGTSKPVGSAGGPYFPPTRTIEDPGAPSSTPPPGGVDAHQGAIDAATAAQTSFRDSQDMAFQRFNRPDEPFPIGANVVNQLGGNQNAGQLAAYMRAFPSGSSIPELIAWSKSIGSGQIPTFQQFAGLRSPATAAPPAPALLQSFIPPGGGNH